MTTPIQQKIRDKKRTPQQILDMVKSGDWIQPGSVGGDSTECMKELARAPWPRPRPGEGHRDLELCELLPPSRISSRWTPTRNTTVFHEYFFFPWNRKARDTNNVTSWANWGWALGMYFCHYRFINAVKEKRGYRLVVERGIALR